MSDGKQIQHLYYLSKGGYAVYDHTEVINIPNAEYKTDIVHLVILPEPEPEPEPLPTLDEVIDEWKNAVAKIDEVKAEIEINRNRLFNGVLPEWLFLQ